MPIRSRALVDADQRPTGRGPKPTRSVADRFWEKVDRPAGEGACWTWIAHLNPQGYGEFSVGSRARGTSVRGTSRMERAHRVAYALAHGSVPRGALVLHRCDNPACVNPRHLYLGTATDNARDRERRRRRQPPKGEANGRAKLDVRQVLELRSLAGSVSGHQLARRFGVSPTTVNNIIRGKRWPHVLPAPPAPESMEEEL